MNAIVMAKRAAKPISMEPSCGNVFADLGLPDATELDTKVRLAVAINRLIKDQRLTQVMAAECLDVSQPKISALKSYKLDGFPVERLMSFLLALGQDVEVRISPRPDARVPGRIVVRMFGSHTKEAAATSSRAEEARTSWHTRQN